MSIIMDQIKSKIPLMSLFRIWIRKDYRLAVFRLHLWDHIVAQGTSDPLLLVAR